METRYDRTFIAIDYGERRMGLAKSDPTGTIASALTTLEVKSDKQALDQLIEIIIEYEPNGLVFGYPLMPSGDKSDKCKKVDAFIEQVEARLGEMHLATPAPVYRVDERYSSVEAAGIIHAHGKKTGQDKRRVDRLAAVIILQRFLDGDSL